MKWRKASLYSYCSAQVGAASARRPGDRRRSPRGSTSGTLKLLLTKSLYARFSRGSVSRKIRFMIVSIDGTTYIN